MKRWFRVRRWCAACLLVLLAWAAAGCGGGAGAVGGVGAVAVAVSIRTVPSGSEQLDKVVLVLTNGGTTVSAEAPIVGKSATAHLSGLAAGDWQIEATAFDTGGYAVYSGTGKARVNRDSSTSVSLSLKPINGSVRLEVNAQDLPGAGQATTVDILVYYAGSTSSYRSYTGLPMSSLPAVVEDTGYAPRSYDMKIVLKTDGGSVVYESEYVQFGVRPGKLTTVQWSPAFGALSILLDLEAMPEPPQNVTVSIEGTQAQVSWDAGAEWVASYRVYWRYSEFDRYSSSRCENVIAPATSASFGLSTSNKGSTVRFVVVARDAAGQESLRSAEACANY